MLQTIDEEEKVKITPKQSLGDLVNYKEYNFLTEDGLYEVLMQSRKPIAKQFKKGVKQILHEVRTPVDTSLPKRTIPPKKSWHVPSPSHKPLLQKEKNG